MRIIVIGAGEVGSYVAERLSREGHDVALIERTAARAGEMASELDALVIRGSGTDPQTLANAAVGRADLFVAVTSDDETNIVSAMLAKRAGVKRSIVRIQERRLREAVAHQLRDEVGAEMLIDPDEETSNEILELVENPGVIEVEAMAGGEILILGVRLAADSPVVGHTLKEVADAYEPNWPFLFAVITRGDETIIPRGDHRLESADLLRVVCTRGTRSELARLLGLRRAALNRVMLLGGGRTAELVAEQLVDRVAHVTIVERDPQRAAELAERLDDVDVLHGDITDTDFLAESDIGVTDLVAALTGDDDANILACLYAKSAGVSETITTAHRLSLLPLLSEVGIDAALSPRTATANAVLRVARGDVTAVATFLHGDVEVVELEIRTGSQAAGKTIAELHLPKDVLVGAVLSKATGPQIGRGATRIEAGDRVIILTKPATLNEVKRALV